MTDALGPVSASRIYGNAYSASSGAARGAQASKPSGGAAQPAPSTAPAQGQASAGAAPGAEEKSEVDGLTDKERALVRQLVARDREVRAHEQAHIAAGGNLVRGSASFEYTTGPDGKRYATGGEVQIDTSGVSGDPQATLAKARRIRQAALAPASPSSQDRAVAAEAAQMAARAQQELAKQAYSSAQAGGSAQASPTALALSI